MAQPDSGFDWGSLGAAIAALGGLATGAYGFLKTRAKDHDDADERARQREDARDERLSQYALELVESLRDEVARLRTEVDRLRSENQRLEREMHALKLQLGT